MPAPLPIHARIAIMGAGCAGLTCAEELRERGYRQVTLFEGQQRAGGKVRSVPHAMATNDGRGLFEAGTVFFIPSPLWTKLLRRHRVSEEVTYMPRVRIADLSSGRSTNPLFRSAGHSLVSRAVQVARFSARLRELRRMFDASPGVAPHVAPEMCGATHDWLAAHRLPFVRDVLLPLAGGAQFGPLSTSVPAIYVLRLLSMLSRYSFVQELRYRMPQLRAGHEAVWTRIASTHDVRYGQAVTQIRAGEGIALETTAGREHFDALIVAAPTNAYLRAATHLDDEERRWFGRVRSLTREVITARVAGLGNVFYAPCYSADNAVPAGHPYMFYEVDRGSGLYTFHPYVEADAQPEDRVAAIRAVVERLGGRLLGIEHRVTVRDWFPHFGEDDLRAGAYAQLEDRQGQRNVWLAGELFAGIGVPHGMEYAASLVAGMTGIAHA